MEDHTEMLIGIMQKTIEQKDEQIKELRQTIADLQATVANLNEMCPFVDNRFLELFPAQNKIFKFSVFHKNNQKSLFCEGRSAFG